MKRILFISQYLNRNGTEAFMMSVFRGIDRTRFCADFLLYSQQETDYSREVVANGGRIFRVPSRRENPIGWYKSLFLFFKKHHKEYSAIHFCGNSVNAMAPIVMAWMFRIPIRIVHAHNSSCQGRSVEIQHKLNRDMAYCMSNVHYACSSAAAKWFFKDKDAEIVKNGIDLDKFKYDTQLRQSKRHELGIEDDCVVIGHVGRFVPEKNHALLIDIFKQYVALVPTARLMLVGNGPLLNEMQSKVKELGLEDSVLFLKERSDVNELMQAMDVFVMPSVFEGAPYVLIEAQAAGLPCLISNRINQDICLTSYVKSEGIEVAPDVWASQISSMLGTHRRTSDQSDIISAGYSIKDTIRKLEKIYTA